ncbi:MAG: KEOPS complex kinase/ATPase Bud32 [Nanoarchaeota archaeon]
MNKIIARGAEAVIEKKGKTVIKKRIVKGYRHPELDEKLRKQRTRAEAKLIERASTLIPVAKIKRVDEQEKELELEYIAGKKLAENFDKLKNKRVIAKKVGASTAKLHDNHIVHGDLTTSNMIYNPQTGETHIIDFGLGFISQKVEDKAVDVHVFKEALEAKHPKNHDLLYKAFVAGYKTSKNASLVLKQLEKVEKRGRYKAQY